MDIGAAVFKPIGLETAKGIFVRRLTDDALGELDKQIKEMEDDWEILRLKVEKMLCDEYGDPLEGMSSVADLKARVSKGEVRDMLQEAAEILYLGKSQRDMAQRIVSRLPSS